LVCSKKTCTQAGAVNYPLRIKATNVENAAVEFNAEFVARIIGKLEWKALVQAAADLQISIPSEVPVGYEKNEDFLKILHTVLLEISVKEGELLCPSCNRAFPIKAGIPNLLLNEDEV